MQHYTEHSVAPRRHGFLFVPGANGNGVRSTTVRCWGSDENRLVVSNSHSQAQAASVDLDRCSLTPQLRDVY